MTARDGSLVPGLALVNPSTLEKAFQRFSSDQLYFIGRILHTKLTEELKPGETPALKRQPRILLITPAAVFLCDYSGRIERGLRLDLIDGLVWERTHSITGRCLELSVCIKCSAEFGIICTIEGHHKDSKTAALFKSLVRVIALAVPFKKRMAGKAGDVSISELEPGRKIEDVATRGRSLDYFRTVASFQARDVCVGILTAVDSETLELRKQIMLLRQSTDGKLKQLRTLESNIGQLHSRREELRRKRSDMRSEQAALEAEVLRLQTMIQFESAHLQQERSVNFNAATLAETLDETDTTLKRANAREIEMTMKHLGALQAEVANPPVYRGPESVCKRACSLEAGINATADKWLKEFDAERKLEEACDAAIRDLTLLNEDIAALVRRKAASLKDREEKQHALLQ